MVNWELRKSALCLPCSVLSLVKYVAIPAVHENDPLQ